MLVAALIGATKLLKGVYKFFQMFGAGVLPLKKALNVSRDKLALDRTVFVPTKLFSSRDLVASGVLGNIHASIGDADNVLA